MIANVQCARAVGIFLIVKYHIQLQLTAAATNRRELQ